jgi:predicted membrane-bound spermidine synthase
VVAELPALAAALPEHTLQHRRTAAAAHRISSPAHVRAWYTDLENRWARTLGRLRLVRNALAHGGPVTAAAAASVAPVVHQLAGGSLLSSLTALTEGTVAADRHTMHRDRCDAWAQDRLSGNTAYKP